MFDINTVNKRYFKIRINDVTLDVEPPKVKVLKKIFNLSSIEDDKAMDGLSEAVNMILTKNRTGYKISQDFIDELDLDEMKQILAAYFEWLGEEKNSKN